VVIETPVLPPGIKLGKLPPKFDRRTLQLPTYIEKRKLPVIPKTHNLSRKTMKAFPDLGMMGNADYGDCTFASGGHLHQTWSVYGGKPWRPTDEEIISAYLTHTGGQDEGAAMLDVLKAWRKDGIGGNRIYAFVAVDPTNHDQVCTASFLFGGLYVGANLPWNVLDRAMRAGGPREWDDVGGNGSQPGSGGGHCMSQHDFAPRGPTLVTWGRLQRVTWAWWDHYVDELYAVLEEDYVGDDRRSPQGFSLKRLAEDIKAL
jgi:hypothetical protein